MIAKANYLEPDIPDPIPDDWIESIRPRLLSVARRQLPADAAEDVVQETLLTAIQKLYTFRGQGKFESWIYSILRRKQADYFRCLRRNKVAYGLTLQGDQEQELLSIAKSKEVSPSEKMQLDELEQSIARGLKTLSEHQFKVLKHCVQTELSTKELAVSLNISVENLWTTLHRARKNLRNQIRAYTSVN